MAHQNIAVQDLAPLARVCAVAVLLIGLMVLAGWALKIEVLKSVLPGLTSMKPNTALCFMLAGIALAQRQRSGLRLACVAAIVALGGLSLAQDVTGASFGTDQLLFLDVAGAAQTVHPGRMSPITAVSLIVLGGALALLGTHRVALRRTLEVLALLAGSLALIALIGYAYDAKAIFPLPGFGSMALLTALALALLALGILCARADGLAGVFASAGLGGQVARRFLPLALIAPVLLGGLVQLGEGAGLFDVTQGTAVFAAAMVLVLVVLSWRNALSLGASDAERQQAEDKLREREAMLRALTERASVGMVMVTAEHRYVFANAACAELLGLPSADIVGQRVADVLAPVYESQICPRLDRAFAGERVAYELTLPPRAPGESERFLAIAYDPPVTAVHGSCVIVVMVDITERKRAEIALRESEAFSRSIIKSSPDCIKVLDLEGNLLSMESGQELLGIEDIEPFLNKSWFDFLEGADDKRAAQAAVASAAAGGAGHFVGFFRTLRGEAKWWDVLISPVLDANGKPARLLVVSRDVTQRQQAEEVLRQRTAQFEILLNEAPIGVFLIDGDFRISQANPVARRVWPAMPELIGRNFDGLMHFLWPKALADGIVEQYRHTLATGEALVVPELVEERIDHGGKEYYEWQINRIPLRAGGYGVVCYFRDISERVLAQQKLRESEERYRTLFNLMDEGFCLIDMIFDGHGKPVDYRFMEVNPAFERQSGMLAAKGKRMRELVPHLEAHWFEIYGQVALTGESIRFTNKVKAMDDRWFDIYVFRLGGTESSKVAVLFNNITERKKAAEALRQSEERLRLAAEAAHFGMYDRDLHGAYFHISGQLKQILGYEPDAPLDHAQVMSHMHPDDRLSGAAAFQRACDPAGGGRIAAEQRIVRRDGAVRWIATVGQVLFEDGAPKRSIGFWVDITERKAAELALRAANIGLERRVEERTRALADKAHQLERASRVKSEFLASMSHELRTPLNGIIGFTEFLHDEKPGPLLPKQKEYLNDVLDSARHLLQLINEVLDIAKVEAGKIEFHPSSLSVAQAIGEARTVIQGSADKKRIAVRIAVGEGLDAVTLDPLRFRQVLYNLLSNAVKFSDEGGQVEIHARRLAANQLEVQVSDTGIGIKAADLGRLFTEFGQIDSGAAWRGEGTGLGLALTKKLVEL